MTDITVIENKISSVRKYLNILERYKGYTRNELSSDIDRRGAVERYLYLVMQASIDLAEALISYKKLRKPVTMAESFHILHEEGLVSQELNEQMVRMTGFRNIMAHDYEKIDYDIVCDVLKNRLKHIEDFLVSISRL